MTTVAEAARPDAGRAEIVSFFDEATCTVTHLVADPCAGRAVVIDSVLDYDATSGRTDTRSAERVVAALQERGLTVDWLLETHAHADHLSAAAYLQRRLGGRIAIGAQITEVQAGFRKLFNAPDIAVDGSPFDRLLAEGDRIEFGTLALEVMHTPGHTPACVSYLLRSEAGLDVFVGDTLFMPDYGSARCDFPGGDAAALYRSVRRLLSLPEDTRLHLCHDYAPGGRPACWVATVGEQRRGNVHLHDGVTEEAFVERRKARDAQLGMPALILPSVQVNVRAGRLPPPEGNGVRYLKIPVNAF